MVLVTEQPEYSYPTDAEFEAKWIEEHRRHRVEADAGNWLMCLTCGIPLKLVTTDARIAVRKIRQ